MAIGALSLSTDLLRSAALPTLPRADQATMAKIKKTSQDFEAAYLSNAISTMFSGVEASEPFGGGEGEAAFKSLLMDAFAKNMTKAGGVGLASAVQKEMLKMQGLTPETGR